MLRTQVFCLKNMSYSVSSDLSIHFAIKTRTAVAFVKGFSCILLW